MGMFGKIGSFVSNIGSNFQANGGFNGLAAALDQSPGAWQDFQDHRQKLAQQGQQQRAMAALMSRMRGPDTQTPVVNQMIDMNNQRMGAFQNGMEHQQGRMDVTKPGLPMDQETMSLLAKYGASGGNMQLPLAMSQMMQPEKMEIQNAGDGYIVGIDPQTGEAKPIYQRPVDPLDQAYRQAQIRSMNALGDQRQHSAGKPYFAPPRARAAPAGPRPSGGSSSTLDAIAAELRRRGHKL